MNIVEIYSFLQIQSRVDISILSSLWFSSFAAGKFKVTTVSLFSCGQIGFANNYVTDNIHFFVHQLPFALIPVLQFTGDQTIMKSFKNGR